MYQQLQKICRGKVCTKKFFGQIWENPGKISFAPPKNCLLLHLCAAIVEASYVDLGIFFAVSENKMLLVEIAELTKIL